MIDQKNFSVGACTLVPQLTWPPCACDVIVDEVHCSLVWPDYYHTQGNFDVRSLQENS